MDESPLVIVIVYVRGPDGKIIAVQKKDGRWTIPCGVVEFSELLQVAASRHVFEETGIEVTDLRMIGFHESPRAADGNHYIAFWFEAATTQTELLSQETESHTTLQWVEFNAIPKPRAGQLDAFWSNTFTPLNGYVRPSRFSH